MLKGNTHLHHSFVSLVTCESLLLCGWTVALQMFGLNPVWSIEAADIAIPDMTEPSGNVAGDSKSLAGVDQLPPNGLDMQDLQEQEVLKFDQEINEGSKTELSAKDDLPGALEKANVPGIDEGIDGEGNASSVPLDSFKLTEEAENQLLREEEARRSQQSRKRKGRIRELEETRAELAEKGLILLLKEKELLEKEQTLVVLREEVSQI